MKKQLIIPLLIVISFSLLTGCKSKQASTENPVSGNPTTGNNGAAYPVPQVNPNSGYPAPGASASVVVDNASQMTVEILSLTPNAKDPQYVTAHVKVNFSVPVEGKVEYNPNLAGQEIDINLTVADASALAVGNILNLKVSFRGDESGSGYYGSEISKE
jgi:hypothetical protein